MPQEAQHDVSASFPSLIFDQLLQLITLVCCAQRLRWFHLFYASSLNHHRTGVVPVQTIFIIFTSRTKITQSSDASNNRQSYDSKVYGKSSVFPAFIRKMQQATGRIVNSSKGYSFHEVQVQTHRVLCAILMQELREWHLSRTTLTNH